MAKKKASSNSPLEDLLAAGEIITMKDTSLMDVETISTGIRSLDRILNGGFPAHKIVEILGKEGSGKSAIAIRCAGAVQQAGGKVVYIDLENTLDPAKAENSGVNMDELFIAQPGSTEETLELMIKLAEATDVGLVVLDSVAMLASEQELAGDLTDASVATNARLIGRALRKITKITRENPECPTYIFINQLRDAINSGPFGPKSTSPGGRALRYSASTRLDVARIGNEKKGEDIVAQNVRVKAIKSKFSRPFQQADFTIHFEMGVINEIAILDDAINAGFIIKSGAWFKDPVTKESLAQGEMKMIEYMKENPEWTEELEAKLEA